MLGGDIVTSFLVFVGFLLLLLVSLSIPIIKTISILNISGKHKASFVGPVISVDVKVGVWGYYASKIDVSILWLVKLLSQTNYYSPPKLGYNIDNRLLKLLKIEHHRDNIMRGMIFVLILHPIACGLAFLALLFTLIHLCRASRLTSTLVLAFSVLAATASTAAFTIDVGLINIARDRVSKATKGGLIITYGNAPWMILGALIVLWAVPLSACCNYCMEIKRRHQPEKQPTESEEWKEV